MSVFAAIITTSLKPSIEEISSVKVFWLSSSFIMISSETFIDFLSSEDSDESNVCDFVYFDNILL